MKKLNQYISEAQQWIESPAAGDQFAIELEDDTLLETYVMGVDSDGSILLDTTEKMYSLLESWNMLEADIDTTDDQLTEMAPLAAMLGRTMASAAVNTAGRAVAQNMHGDDQQKPVNEFDIDRQLQADPGEYDQEGDMAKNELLTIIRAARKLSGMLGNDDNMPEWTQKKITKAADYVDTAADYISSQKERGVMESDEETSPAARAILHRILMRHPSLLAAHGPAKVMSAVDEVAEYIGDVDEIGSSDVSGWIRHVEQMLGNMDQGMAEAGNRPVDRQFPLGTGDTRTARELKTQMQGASDEFVKGAAKEVGPMHSRVAKMQGKLAKSELRRRDQGVAEGLPQTLRKIVPGYAKREIDKKMDAEKFGRTDVDRDANYYRYKKIQDKLKKQGVAEGPNDGKEDNFTIDDIKNLEQIRDLETLKAQAKELIKGKPARRMKPEKISWFYNHIDTLKNPLAVIKMMYDLMLAGEGNKVIGSRNSMSSNSYRSKFGEQDVSEHNIDEAEYQGRKVPLGKPMQGDVAKSKVYVRDPKTGNVKKVNFGDPNMKIRKSNPGARKSFRARHNCDNPGPRTKARYWSCRAW